MTRSRSLIRNWIVALCSLAALVLSTAATADPPGRVARLAQISGTVSFSPAGEEDWVLAQPNRPLITGDRLWSDTGSRVELQVGTASVRLGSATSASILNLDDRVAQIEVAQGTLNLRVRRVYADQVYEIDTPNLAFSVRRAGDYRIDVDPNGNATIIRVRSGEGEAWGQSAAYTVGAGQQYTFTGESLRDYTYDRLPASDAFDNWAFDRNRREDAAVTSRYVSPDIVGYSDLDDYGTWRAVEGYGNVWFPTSVAADWVPYRTGHWAWIDPWGWTWVDDAPWGFAPFHYGRWAYVSTRWCWVPGPVAVRPIYAPALVAFVGGGGFSLSISTGPVNGIAWFPLGPGEVYRPAYTVSRSYFTNVNVANTVVNTTVVNNVYNNVNVTNIVYKNREAPGAVTAVPAAAFTSAQPVQRNHIAVPRDVVTREPVSNVVAVAPSHASVLAVGAAAAGAAAAVAVAKRPPQQVLERRVVAKTAPPPPPPSFATKASLLAAQPGKPLEAEKLKAMQPGRAAEKERFKVVSPTVTPQPLSKEGGKGSRGAGSGPTPPAAAGPQSPQQERAMREGKDKGGPPPSAAVPQPPQPQRAMRENKGGPPPGVAGPQPQPERALRENKGGPPPGVAGPQPQPERALRENKGGPPPGAVVPQPQPERAMRENKSGPPPGAAVPQPPKERAMRENKSGPPTGAAPPPPQAQKAGPPPGAAAPPPQVQKAGPPPGPQAGPKPEEGRGKGKEKDKEKERKDGQ